MKTILRPQTLEEIREAVRSSSRVMPLGGGTKPRMSAVEATGISLAEWTGLVEYDPSEFTFTAKAGTQVREVVAALAERGQYLPFDPPWCAAGSTLGGMVAGGVAGPGRWRFGGIRDFLLGVRLVDGAGRVLRLGGKVVKNSAGFEVPKFMVGSAGRFGLLAELTFKVFPQPPDSLTLRLRPRDLTETVRTLLEISNTTFEPEAVEVPADGLGIAVRLTGPSEALTVMAAQWLARWPGERLDPEQAGVLWTRLREFEWVPSGAALIRVAMIPTQLPAFMESLSALNDSRCHVGVGGQVAFVALPSAADVFVIDLELARLGLSGVLLRGEGPLWMGLHPVRDIATRVKAALDAEERFPGLED